MKRSAWFSAVLLSASLCTGAFAQVTGTVKLKGKAPERKPVPGLEQNPQCAALHKDPPLDETIIVDPKTNGLVNVFVYLKAPNVKGEAPKDKVVLDQKGCQYIPHVVDITVGQELVATNEDAFLHNVHSLPENKEPDNVAMPGVDKAGVKLKPVKAAEFFKVKCDVHPWMNAWVGVFDHPYHTVTGDDGTYQLETTGLPNGDYELVFWHEKFKESKAPEGDDQGRQGDEGSGLRVRAARRQVNGRPATLRLLPFGSVSKYPRDTAQIAPRPVSLTAYTQPALCRSSRGELCDPRDLGTRGVSPSRDPSSLSLLGMTAIRAPEAEAVKMPPVLRAT